MAKREITVREREVLMLVSAGAASREIAARLGISRATVESHVRSAMCKVGARTRLHAVLLLAAPEASAHCTEQDKRAGQVAEDGEGVDVGQVEIVEHQHGAVHTGDDVLRDGRVIATAGLPAERSCHREVRQRGERREAAPLVNPSAARRRGSAQQRRLSDACFADHDHRPALLEAIAHRRELPLPPEEHVPGATWSRSI
jgi:DNA-binding CsgD family transcriptional regulator